MGRCSESTPGQARNYLTFGLPVTRALRATWELPDEIGRKLSAGNVLKILDVDFAIAEAI